MLLNVSVLFYLLCVYMIFSKVKEAEWSPFEKELHTRLTECSLCIMSICDHGCFLFWCRGHDFNSDYTSPWPLLTFYFGLGTVARSVACPLRKRVAPMGKNTISSVDSRRAVCQLLASECAIDTDKRSLEGLPTNKVVK